MDLKKIIKEEVNDFEWTESAEPKLKTFRVSYRSEMIIDAYDYEEAQQIYYGVDLNDVNNSINHNMNEPGVRSNDWYDTTDFDEYEEF